MHCFRNGLCVCLVGFSLMGCTQDKKLPQGERLSILDNASYEDVIDNSSITSIPQAIINRDWDQNGRNTRHIVGNLKANTKLEKKWSNSFGSGVNKRDITISQPVVYNNTIFVMDVKGLVSAYDLSSGDKLWENMLSTNTLGLKDTRSKASGLAVSGDTLYATTGFGGVFAIDRISGKPKWRKILDAPIRIAPTIANNMLLIQTIDNKLHSLDKQNGEEIWRFGVASEDTVIVGGASPAFDEEENVVVAGFSNGEIVVINANVGTPLWSEMLTSNNEVNSTTNINTIGAYPIIENGTIYAIGNSDVLVALDMRTGDKLWKKEIGSMQDMLLVGDYLFVISNKNILYAIEKNEGSIIWSIDIKNYLYDNEKLNGEVYASHPIMVNGDILLTFSNGKIFKINALKGILTAKIDLDTDISNGLIIANDKIIAASDNANVIVFQ